MFILKKIIAQFFTPVSLSLELIIAGIFILYLTSKQKTGKILVMIGAAVLVFCSYTPTSDFLIKPLVNKYLPYAHDIDEILNEKPKFVVVLGAAHSDEDNAPIVSRMGYDTMVRLIEGVRIYRMIPQVKLLLSGGSEPGTISSAQDMSQLAMELGVNKEDIIIESASRDTEDEAYIVGSMIGSEPFVLVTSSVHMSRSVALFKKYGMNPVPAPTRSIEERLFSRTPNPFFPSSINLQKSEAAFHEYLGIIWAKMRRHI